LACAGRIGILSESYSYASFKERVIASREFVRGCLEFVAEHSDEVKKVLDEAAKPAERQVLEYKLVARPQAATVLGFATGPDGKTDLNQPKDYSLQVFDRAEVVTLVRTASDSVFDPEQLRDCRRESPAPRHRRAGTARGYRVAVRNGHRAKDRAFDAAISRHSVTTLETTSEPAAPKRIARRGHSSCRRINGSAISSPCLLEPASDDSLATWNLLDAALKEGEAFPILRLAKEVSLTVTAARPLADERVRGQADLSRATFSAPCRRWASMSPDRWAGLAQ